MYHSGMPRLFVSVQDWPEFLTGVLIATVLIGGTVAACGSSVLVQCRVDAIEALPLDSDTVTLGDVREVVRRVKACQLRGDAGP